MALTKSDSKEIAKELWAKLVSGENEEDLIDLFGLDKDTYEVVRKMMLEEEAQKLRERPPEHTYVEYILWQQRGISDLTDLIEKQKLRTAPNANAMVAAIKVRSDIYGKIIEKGQEFGVLKKAPDTKIVVGGHFVAELTSDDLRKQITKSISEMDKLMKRYGDVPMTEVDHGDIHYGPKLLTDSSTMETTTIIEAPPAKDDMLAVVAKPVPAGPKGPKIKGKNFKAKKPSTGSKSLGVRTQAVKEENRRKKSEDLESWNWGD